MARSLCAVLTIVGLLAAAVLALGGLAAWPAPLVLACAAGYGWARTCAHRYVSLLPAEPDGGPERDHPRWYCGHCGHEWRARAPRSLAWPLAARRVRAARTAAIRAEWLEQLELRQRRLRLQRARRSSIRPIALAGGVARLHESAAAGLWALIPQPESPQPETDRAG